LFRSLLTLATPRSTTIASRGTASRVAARSISASRAVAQASARFAWLKFAGCDWLPDVVPWSGQIDVSHMISFTRSTATESSSAISCVWAV
jgi:hypothetical protein